MDTQSLRLRLTFDDCSVLTLAQRSNGMNNSWILIEPNQHPNISDVCNHLLHKFNLHSSCPNGIQLYMEGFVLPPSELIRILKDKDIICVKRKEMALAEAIDEVDGCNLFIEEVNRREPVDNGVLLLANEEFDKEIGGYQSESEDAEEKSEDKPSPKETSKKRKASTKLRISKKKKHRIENNGINSDECPSMKIVNKKIKSNKKRSDESETIIKKVKSPSKVKREKKHCLGVVFGDDDEIVKDEIVNVNNGENILKKEFNKKVKPNEEVKKVNAETSDMNIEEDVEVVEQPSTTPDGAKKVPSRSARRKKAKRQRRHELAQSSQNPNTNVEPKISKTEDKEATDHPEGLLKQDQAHAKVMHHNIVEEEGRNHNDNGLTKLVSHVVKPGHIEEEGRNRNDNGVTKLVPHVVKPGHIRFEPLDGDEDAKQIEVPDVAFQWNGITNKKKGQKWGLEKFSFSKRDDYQEATEEPFTVLSVDAQIPLIAAISFDQLPPCSSPKEGDVIAYRILELSSSWTPELSPFRVGKVSRYDADYIVLMPVPEYPIVLDEMDENGPDNSLYKEDGSLEIKFAVLADVRCLNQSTSDSVNAVSNVVKQTTHVDEKKTASNLMSVSNDNKEDISEDPRPVVGNKEGNTWNEIEELLNAKKSELLETNEEMKRDSGWNKWSYRALRGSALGPTISLLRSGNNI